MSRATITFSTKEGTSGFAIYDRITHVVGTESDKNCLIVLDNGETIETADSLWDLRNRIEVAFKLRMPKQDD